MKEGSSALLSVIIVNWETRELLRNCLHALYHHAPALPCEVFVVDNNSRDGSVAMLHGVFPQVQVIANTQNRGFAAANNQAIRRAAGEYILLLNSDTCVLPGALDRMIAFMQDTPACGICGAGLVSPDGAPQRSYAAYMPTVYTQLCNDVPFPMIRRWVSPSDKVHPVIQLPEAPFAVECVIGASLMIRRAAMAEIGLLDETYFFYAEDVDWCIRARRAGWQIYCIPAARIIHYGGQSSQKAAERCTLEYYRSLYRFFQKYSRPLYIIVWRLLSLCFMLWELVRAAAACMYRRRNESKLREHRATAARYRALIRFMLFAQ